MTNIHRGAQTGAVLWFSPCLCKPYPKESIWVVSNMFKNTFASFSDDCASVIICCWTHEPISNLFLDLFYLLGLVQWLPVQQQSSLWKHLPVPLCQGLSQLACCFGWPSTPLPFLGLDNNLKCALLQSRTHAWLRLAVSLFGCQKLFGTVIFSRSIFTTSSFFVLIRIRYIETIRHLVSWMNLKPRQVNDALS